MEPIKDNEEAVKAYGIHFATEMCKKILAHGITTLHIYTLNVDKSAIGILMVVPHFLLSFFCFSSFHTHHLHTLENLTMVLKLQNLGLIDESKITRSLPWRPPANVFRTKEDVRPIFW